MKGIIIYASKTGTVESIAKKLKTKLDGGYTLANIHEKPDINLRDYDKVILGTYMRRRKGDTDLREYVNINKEKLIKKPLFIFVSAAEIGDIYKRELRDTFPKEILEDTDVYNIGAKIDPQKLQFMERIMVNDIAKRQGKTIDKLNNLDESKLDNFAEIVNTFEEEEEDKDLEE